jgi:CelD/BcsL family acetyltransferase involved in cellulose biosynthesis
VKIELHDRLEAIGPSAWHDVLASSRLRAPFLSYTWQREWARSFAHGRRLEIRTVKSGDGRLVAILPLYEAEPGRFVLIGGADISDYLDLLVVAGHEQDAWTALLESRAGASAIWELHCVPEASPTVTLLPGLAVEPGLTVTTAVEERCPVLVLPESWDAYLERLSSKDRHELQRKIRRLQREASDARMTCVRRPDDVQTRIGDFLDLHRRSRVGKARFMDAHMESFFRQIVVLLAEEGVVRLWFLDTASGPAAAFICLEWDGTVGLYNSGFHPDHAALSPGLVLLAHIVRDAIERNKERFDFLRGEERYKYEFGPVAEAVYTVKIGGAEGTGEAEPRASGYSPPTPVAGSTSPLQQISRPSLRQCE